MHLTSRLNHHRSVLCHDVDQVALTAFAHATDVLLDRGLAYGLGVNEDRTPLELACELGSEIRHLKRMADLAEAYVEWNVKELESAAILAVSRRSLSMATVNACIENDERLLRTLGPSGAFARCLIEWRRLEAAGDPPPQEYVGYHLGIYFGECVDKHTREEIACNLAVAFRPDQLTVDEALRIVDRHFGASVTPALAEEFAAEAITLARQRRAGELPPVDTQDEEYRCHVGTGESG